MRDATGFPIAPLLPQVRASLDTHPRLVLEAPPGAGKTTQVPLALLDAGWLAGRRIVMLEPRRVAARAAAGFMARQLGVLRQAQDERVGDTVGYRIRFESRVSARTRIEVVTEGILTRMLQDDPTLGEGRADAVGALLFDEFHERQLAGDLGLALALDVQASLRPDLRIVLMSATLDGARLAEWLDAPRLTSEGRAFPVAVSHVAARRDEAMESHAARAIRQALAAHPGDVLAFLPGQREIARVAALLAPLHAQPDDTRAQDTALPPLQVRGRVEDELGESRRASTQPPPNLPLPPQGEEQQQARDALLPPLHVQGRVGKGLSESRRAPTRSPPNLHLHPQRAEHGMAGGLADASSSSASVEVLQLHGDLPVDQQSRVLQPSNDGRRRVVLATNVAESSVTLPGVRVVVDSGLAREPRFDPNSGFSRLDVVAVSQASADQRAGRAGRIADGWAYRLWPASQRLEPQRRAEIVQVELSALALELAAWGSAALRFLDPPPPGALAAARDLLQALGALDASHAITPLGRRMHALGAHPRLAAMLLACDAGARALACDLVALVEARDPLRSRSDALAERWQALAAFRAGRVPGDAHRGGLAAIDAAASQWRRRLQVDARPPAHVAPHALGDLLLHAFPDRIARQHPDDAYRYVLSSGRIARVADDSALYGEPWIVADGLRFEPGRYARVLRGAPLDEQALRAAFPERFVEEDVVRWEASRRALVAQRERRYAGIVLDARPAGRVDPGRAAQALADAAAALGLDALPWTDALVQWRARIRCLRAWMPEACWPDLSDAALLDARDHWLRPAFAGATRLDALTAQAFDAALRTRVDWSLQRDADRLAPVRIEVPSGMARAIAYGYDDDLDAPRAPVLAVKLQELFGLGDTPRIADGRVPLTLHLLSPAGRPLQVTQDLRGFWERTYPEVRREMKGRYPKHPWPEDPWNAPATHRAKPRA